MSDSKPKWSAKKEAKLLKDVKRKNTFFRAIPLSLLSMGFVKGLMSYGLMSSQHSQRKLFAGAFVGFFMARMTMKSTLERRVLKECPEGLWANLYFKPRNRRNSIEGS